MSFSEVSSILKNSWPPVERQQNIRTVTFSSFSIVCFEPSGSMKCIRKSTSSLKISWSQNRPVWDSKAKPYFLLASGLGGVECFELAEVQVGEVDLSRFLLAGLHRYLND